MSVPLVVFVNSKSGGLQGPRIIEKFKRVVPPENVFDLAQGGPLAGLQKYGGQRYRIIVCGGDGSVGWVLTEIEKLKLSREMTPPVAVLPIGTGNDLARVLKWGASHKGTKLNSFIGKTERACVVHLDRWRVSYEGEGLPHAEHSMNNYFSVGADAHIALQFHEARLAHPEKFTSRAQNLAWYVKLGMLNMSPESIGPHLIVEINGEKVQVPDQTKCIVVLNLPSYSGGANPWGTKKSTRRKFAHPSIDDGMLEVVAMNGPLQLVGVHVNLIRAKRLGQGNSVRITTAKALAAQVDGEPWIQPSSVININFVGKSHMLANSGAPNTDAALAAAPLNLSTSAMAREESAVYNRTLSARTLVRTRSSSAPIVHTPSPIKYGPVDPNKRKKGRLYCNACGLEFYLPYMLDNHHNSGLCSNGASSSSSSGKAKVEVADGASISSSPEEEVEVWRSQSAELGRRKKSDVSAKDPAWSSASEQKPVDAPSSPAAPSSPKESASSSTTESAPSSPSVESESKQEGTPATDVVSAAEVKPAEPQAPAREEAKPMPTQEDPSRNSPLEAEPASAPAESVSEPKDKPEVSQESKSDSASVLSQPEPEPAPEQKPTEDHHEKDEPAHEPTKESEPVLAETQPASTESSSTAEAKVASEGEAKPESKVHADSNETDEKPGNDTKPETEVKSESEV